MSRIAARFNALRAAGRGGLVTFLTAGDPDPDTSLEILRGLPAAGADLIELGMPFSDPMADGPAIQAASQRALEAGMSLRKTLDLVRAFRAEDADTPVILMGYYNPVYVYGVDAFARDAAAAGVDGTIIVDLPPEEAAELNGPLRENGLDFVFLTAPTTDDARLERILAHASGFVYYVSIAGITGTASASLESVRAAVGRIKAKTGLPVAVGFGIKTPDQVGAVAGIADAAVVGSAIVDRIAHGVAAGRCDPRDVLAFVETLSAGLKDRVAS